MKIEELYNQYKNSYENMNNQISNMMVSKEISLNDFKLLHESFQDLKSQYEAIYNESRKSILEIESLGKLRVNDLLGRESDLEVEFPMDYTQVNMNGTAETYKKNISRYQPMAVGELSSGKNVVSDSFDEIAKICNSFVAHLKEAPNQQVNNTPNYCNFLEQVQTNLSSANYHVVNAKTNIDNNNSYIEQFNELDNIAKVDENYSYLNTRIKHEIDERESKASYGAETYDDIKQLTNKYLQDLLEANKPYYTKADLKNIESLIDMYNKSSSAVMTNEFFSAKSIADMAEKNNVLTQNNIVAGFGMNVHDGFEVKSEYVTFDEYVNNVNPEQAYKEKEDAFSKYQKEISHSFIGNDRCHSKEFIKEIYEKLQLQDKVIQSSLISNDNNLRYKQEVNRYYNLFQEQNKEKDMDTDKSNGIKNIIEQTKIDPMQFSRGFVQERMDVRISTKEHSYKQCANRMNNLRQQVIGDLYGFCSIPPTPEEKAQFKDTVQSYLSSIDEFMAFKAETCKSAQEVSQFNEDVRNKLDNFADENWKKSIGTMNLLSVRQVEGRDVPDVIKNQCDVSDYEVPNVDKYADVFEKMKNNVNSLAEFVDGMGVNDNFKLQEIMTNTGIGFSNNTGVQIFKEIENNIEYTERMNALIEKFNITKQADEAQLFEEVKPVSSANKVSRFNAVFGEVNSLINDCLKLRTELNNEQLKSLVDKINELDIAAGTAFDAKAQTGKLARRMKKDGEVKDILSADKELEKTNSVTGDVVKSKNKVASITRSPLEFPIAVNKRDKDKYKSLKQMTVDTFNNETLSKEEKLQRIQSLTQEKAEIVEKTKRDMVNNVKVIDAIDHIKYGQGGDGDNVGMQLETSGRPRVNPGTTEGGDGNNDKEAVAKLFPDMQEPVKQPVKEPVNGISAGQAHKIKEDDTLDNDAKEFANKIAEIEQKYNNEADKAEDARLAELKGELDIRDNKKGAKMKVKGKEVECSMYDKFIESKIKAGWIFSIITALVILGLAFAPMALGPIFLLSTGLCVYYNKILKDYRSAKNPIVEKLKKSHPDLYRRYGYNATKFINKCMQYNDNVLAGRITDVQNAKMRLQFNKEKQQAKNNAELQFKLQGKNVKLEDVPPIPVEQPIVKGRKKEESLDLDALDGEYDGSMGLNFGGHDGENKEELEQDNKEQIDQDVVPPVDNDKEDNEETKNDLDQEGKNDSNKDALEQDDANKDKEDKDQDDLNKDDLNKDELENNLDNEIVNKDGSLNDLNKDSLSNDLNVGRDENSGNANALSKDNNFYKDLEEEGMEHI